jgi:hypothetical protein
MEGGDLEAVKKLSGGAGTEPAGVKVRQDLLERNVKRCGVRDARERPDGGGFGGAALVVVAKTLATEGGAAAAPSVGMGERAAWGRHGEAEMGAGTVCHPGGGGGAIDSRDSRV